MYTQTHSHTLSLDPRSCRVYLVKYFTLKLIHKKHTCVCVSLFVGLYVCVCMCAVGPKASIGRSLKVREANPGRIKGVGCEMGTRVAQRKKTG